jgi:hypothetical protein
MVDAVARRRSEYEFARQDAQLNQDRYRVSDKSADFGSQGCTPLHCGESNAAPKQWPVLIDACQLFISTNPVEMRENA